MTLARNIMLTIPFTVWTTTLHSNALGQRKSARNLPNKIK